MSDFDRDEDMPFIENTSTSDVGQGTKKSIKNKNIEHETVDTYVPETRTESVPILLQKYFEMYAPDVHPYTMSFVSADYHGILKSKEEWDIELTGKL